MIGAVVDIGDERQKWSEAAAEKLRIAGHAGANVDAGAASAKQLYFARLLFSSWHS